MKLGPGSPLGHGSIVSSIERVTEYFTKMITKLQTENYGSLVPKKHIPRAYQKQALAWLEKSAWNSDCVSTYKNGSKDGPLLSLHPGSRLHFFELLRSPRYEDYDWQSLCSDPDLTFAWLANGFTLDEEEQKGDLTLVFPETFFNTKKSCFADLDVSSRWFLPPVKRENFIRSMTVNGTDGMNGHAKC